MTNSETDIFLLTSGAADEGGGCVLNYWGIGPEGPVRVRLSKHSPLFFIPRSLRLAEGIPGERRNLGLLSFDNNKVDGLYFTTMAAYREARRRLKDAGERTWESDVRPEDRYLMERFITGSARVRGLSHQDGLVRIYENPQFLPSDWRPNLTTMSLDIETGRTGTLYGVAVDIAGPRGTDRRVAVLDPDAPSLGRQEPDSPTRFLSTEADLVKFFIEAVLETDPDVIIGWHVIGFDLTFLNDKAREFNLPLRIGRGHAPLRLIERPGSLPIVDLEGRLVIDGPPVLRGAFFRFSDWRLGTVASELLGRKKDIEAQGQEKVNEIERRFQQDKAALARYNLEDAVLVTQIFHKTEVLKQIVTRSLITGLPPDQVHRSVAAFDRFFLPRLHRKGYVAPNQGDITASKPAPGGMVFTSGAGLFEDVVVLDFKSLYPTVIRTFHIDPYSLIQASGDPLETPTGIKFSKSEYILPLYIEELMAKREQAKTDGDKPLSQAVKILMNSMYGVMGSPGSRFYRWELPTAITGIGRWILESTAEKLASWGYKVLYGDTDSVFVKLKENERLQADESGERLARRIDEWFKDAVKKEYEIPSRLEMEYEKHYLRLFLPVMRSAGEKAEGAVKRYAGLLSSGEIEIKGMEFVRSDATQLARDFQYELFRRVFGGEDLTSWIRDVVSRLRSGEFDDKLVYRRRLSRPAWDYKSPPPHVKAVRLLDPDGTRDLREVEYVITPEGPMPLAFPTTEIDYNHYIEKQLRALADDVLSLQNRSFDAIIGGRQLDLF